MSAHEYHFITHWVVTAPCEEVYSILSDAEGLKRWWPSVYLDTKILKEGNSENVGKEVALYTKGWLPYTLHWQFEVIETRKPHGFTIKANGDFVGRGIWEFKQEEEECMITFDWKLDAEKPFLKNFSFLLKPIFSANHKWAMKKGEESLRLELMRRNAFSEDQLDAVPNPPSATFPHNFINNQIF